MKALVSAGTPSEVGHQFGETFREAISEGAARLEDPKGWTVHGYEAAVAKYLLYNLEHAPELIEELKGLARGAAVGFESVLRLSSDGALGYARERSGCTNFAAVTSDAGPVLCKTEDHGGGFGKENFRKYVVHHVKPASGHRYIVAVTTPNYHQSTGINEHGLAVGQSSGPHVYGNQDGSGINYLAFIRLVLGRCATAVEGAALLTDLKMCGKGFLFMLADAEGGIRAVEKCYDRHAVRQPSKDALFFANRFEAPTMQDFPARHDADHADARFRNLSAQFEKAGVGGGYTLDLMRQTLALHADAGSICRHGTDSPADFGGVSEPSFIYRCRDRQMGVFPGVPCQTEPEWFGLDF
jgi:predicted choloylglycine hydrolase